MLNRIIIMGRLTRDPELRRKRTAWEVIADSVYFTDSKKDVAYAAQSQQFGEISDEDDGDLPF